jgi:hypothetical protein
MLTGSREGSVVIGFGEKTGWQRVGDSRAAMIPRPAVTARSFCVARRWRRSRTAGLALFLTLHAASTPPASSGPESTQTPFFSVPRVAHQLGCPARFDIRRRSHLPGHSPGERCTQHSVVACLIRYGLSGAGPQRNVSCGPTLDITWCSVAVSTPNPRRPRSIPKLETLC